MKRSISFSKLDCGCVSNIRLKFCNLNLNFSIGGPHLSDIGMGCNSKKCDLFNDFFSLRWSNKSIVDCVTWAQCSLHASEIFRILIIFFCFKFAFFLEYLFIKFNGADEIPLQRFHLLDLFTFPNPVPAFPFFFVF